MPFHFVLVSIDTSPSFEGWIWRYFYGIINLFKSNRNDGGIYWGMIEVISYEALLSFAESADNKAVFTEMTGFG